MNYYAEKTMEHRLEEARLLQRNADLAREARALETPRGTATPRWFRVRFSNRTPVRLRAKTGRGGAA